MFSEMMATIRQNQLPDASALQKRFDYAMTKKLGVLNLPPAFWMQDPKINPPVIELFWAALLLRDRERIDMAMAVLDEEMNKSSQGKIRQSGAELKKRARQLTEELLQMLSNTELRTRLRQELAMIIPDVLGLKAGGECCE